MKRSTLFFTIGAVVLAFGAAACSGDSTTGPGLQVSDAEITAGVANDAGDAIATSVDLMGTDAEMDGASASLGLGSDITGSVEGASASITCTGPDGDGWYTCAGTTFRGLSLTRMVRFWDGDSPALSFTSATDSVNHIHTLTGSYVQGWAPHRTVWVNNADTSTMHVNRSGDPVQHIWDGVGLRNDSTQFVGASVTRTWRYAASDTVDAVTFDMPRSSNPWPVSGTIVHDLMVHFTAQSAARTFDRTLTRRVVVTFNGTQQVTLQVGGLTCTLDLQTHEVSGCSGS